MASPTRQRQTAARARRSVVEQQILEAAGRFLADRPFHELTIEEVMSSTGMTRTAFYRYFPDLDSVLIRALANVSEDLLVSADWLESAEPGRYRPGLEAAAGRLVAVYRAHGPLLRAAVDASVFSPRIGAAWHEVLDRFTATNADRIRQLVAAGVTSAPDATELARALVLMTESYLRDAASRDTTRYEVVTETLVQIWDKTLFG